MVSLGQPMATPCLPRARVVHTRFPDTKKERDIPRGWLMLPASSIVGGGQRSREEYIVPYTPSPWEQAKQSSLSALPTSEQRPVLQGATDTSKGTVT